MGEMQAGSVAVAIPVIPGALLRNREHPPALVESTGRVQGQDVS